MHTAIKHTLTAALATTLLTFAGCQCADCASNDNATVAAAPTAPINTVCPIGGHAIPQDAPTATVAGNTIAFCGEGCAGAFADMTDAERQDVLATAMAED